MIDFDNEVAGYLGMLTEGNGFENWGRWGFGNVGDMAPALRLAYLHAGSMWIGAALMGNGQGGLKPAGVHSYVYFTVRTYMDYSTASGSHREIETLFTNHEFDPEGDLLEFIGSAAGVTFIVAGTACLAGAAMACPVAGGAAAVNTGTSVYGFVDTCAGGGSGRACGGAAFDAVLGIMPIGKAGQGFRAAEDLLGVMSTVVGGSVSMALADREGSAADVRLTSSMAAG